MNDSNEIVLFLNISLLDDLCRYNKIKLKKYYLAKMVI